MVPPFDCSMEEEAYQLDDRYTEGVWYDQMNGDFCEIQESDDGELVELVNPENGNVYWDMPVSTWVEDEKQDFRQVSDEAVEDPVDFYIVTVENLVDAAQYQGKSLPFSEEISFRYARQQVEISES